MEHWEQLSPGGLRFVYTDGLFRPGTDTFLLSSLPRLKPDLRVCDLGCGTGLLSLLLLQRQRDLFVTGVEFQAEAAALAARAAAENGLREHFTVLQGDLREIRTLLPAGGFDLVVCNPPYYPVDSGHAPAAPALRDARGESGCTLDDVCRAASYLLRWGGDLCLCHKPERLADVCCALRAHGLEAKRLRPVLQRPDSALPSLVLIEGRRGGKPGLRWLSPLVLEGPGGIPAAELDAIYFRQQEDTP